MGFGFWIFESSDGTSGRKRATIFLLQAEWKKSRLFLHSTWNNSLGPIYSSIMTNQTTSRLERRVGPLSGPYLDIGLNRDRVLKSGLHYKHCWCWKLPSQLVMFWWWWYRSTRSKLAHPRVLHNCEFRFKFRFLYGWTIFYLDQTVHIVVN